MNFQESVQPPSAEELAEGAPDEADAEAVGRPVSMLNEASPELVGNAPEAEPLPVGKPAPLPLPPRHHQAGARTRAPPQHREVGLRPHKPT